MLLKSIWVTCHPSLLGRLGNYVVITDTINLFIFYHYAQVCMMLMACFMNQVDVRAHEFVPKDKGFIDQIKRVERDQFMSPNKNHEHYVTAQNSHVLNYIPFDFDIIKLSCYFFRIGIIQLH